MNEIRGTMLGALAVASMGMTGAANAALISILGGQAVYDNTQNISWLANANLASTSGYCSTAGNCLNATGQMRWAEAQAWIASLNAGSGHLGITNWRLPDTAQPDPTCASQLPVSGFPNQGFGFNCTGSEMGNLFYNGLGGVANTNISTTHNASYDLFSNVQGNYYWSGTSWAPSTTNAWDFIFVTGGQNFASKVGGGFAAWAVAPGNISAVPVPAAVWLFGSALGVMGWMRRKATS